MNETVSDVVMGELSKGKKTYNNEVDIETENFSYFKPQDSRDQTQVFRVEKK